MGEPNYQAIIDEQMRVLDRSWSREEALLAENQRLRGVLEKIASQDYRGPMPEAQRLAAEALEANSDASSEEPR